MTTFSQDNDLKPLQKQLNQAADTSDLLHELLEGLQQAAKQRVPHFLATMPNNYFTETDHSQRLNHIKAIIAADTKSLAQGIMISDDEHGIYTFISNRNYPGQLSKYVRSLPNTCPLDSAKVYTAADKSIVLDVFHFGCRAPYSYEQEKHLVKACQMIEHAKTLANDITQDQLDQHLRLCSADYVLTSEPDRLCEHFKIVKQVYSTGNAYVALEKHQGKLSHINVCIGHVDRRLLFERITHYLGQRSVNINGAYLDSFEQPNSDIISLLSFEVSVLKESVRPEPDELGCMTNDLQRILYLDESVLDIAEQLQVYNILHAEIIFALSHLVHQLLVKRDSLAYSRDRITKTLLKYSTISQTLAELFVERFKPLTKQDFATESKALSEQIKDQIDDQDQRTILTTILEVIEASLRCNLFFADRSAFIVKIKPEFLATAERSENPFGVFFVCGRGFDGFHVRFRDIARGGVRIVRPNSVEQYALEVERLYDEVYGLALAQQLKNKDIPEGGSKGVILACPDADLDRVGRYFADALLDLLVPDIDNAANSVDYYGQNELLYLGPDENVSDDLIIWIVERARLRRHSMPDAFMSSKPGAGINHKTYGVTSEGVTVFMETALRHYGIDPRKEVFTVKIVGGPDGDVAGNEIKILYREFGENARIIGIADGSGCLEDPNAINSQELLRLVNAGLAVSHFNPDRLSSHGQLLSISQPGGLQARNSMHNRLVTNVFIPAGGRPRTINHDNWRGFLTSNGVPTSKIIVEGANLFITPSARNELAEKGAIIIKDSSANKCGVICSSYEIIASMLLTADDFLMIKQVFVEQVLEKLKTLARIEAEALFREHRSKTDVTLAELSIRLSQVINRASDVVTDILHDLNDTDRALTLGVVNDYLPDILVQTAGEHIYDRIPPAYLAHLIASSLASKIVYREGLNWFEQMPDLAIKESVLNYLRAEDNIKQLLLQVEQSNLPDKTRITVLLQEGGVAALLRQLVS